MMYDGKEMVIDFERYRKEMSRASGSEYLPSSYIYMSALIVGPVLPKAESPVRDAKLSAFLTQREIAKSFTWLQS